MRTPLACLVACLLLLAGPARAQTPPFVWIEAERATANVPLEAKGWGKKEFLSEEKWLQISVDADKVEKAIPADGAMLRYPLAIATPGRYRLWDRIGYEFARSVFEWRVDNGAWQSVSPETLTRDLMTIETWNEVAWLKLGEAELTAGEHTLEIRLPRTKDKDGKPNRVLYASDVLCLVASDWLPYSKVKPGDDHQTDRDRAAAQHQFTLPAGETRQSVALAGDWEVCRADEDLPPFDIAQPMDPALPPQTRWSAIPVPSDKNTSRPDLVFAHRLWYRTRVVIPPSETSAYVLTFPRNNLNTTVVVNGILCGFNKNPNAPFQIDITKAVRPGAVNEIRVGIRDPWYAYSGSPADPMKLRRKFNLPLSFVGQGFQDLSYPVWNAWQSGIVQTPTLTSVGKVYVTDVFIQPRVSPKKTVLLTVTVRNSSDERRDVAVVAGVLPLGQPTTQLQSKESSDLQILEPDTEKTFTLTVPADSLKLWWPEPNPALYNAVVFATPNIVQQPKVRLQPDNTIVRFGMREWGVRGKDFLLNGQVWHGWADLNEGSDPQSWLTAYRKHNQRFLRLSGYAQGGPTWLGLTPGEALDFFDANGVVVRRSGDLDGEAIGYMAIENDPELKKRYGSEIKLELMQNWRDQLLQQIKAERNHPSIHLWSIENEWLYINCINLYGHLMDDFEKAVLETGNAVAALDPTRLWMTDGGGAGKANAFPVHGDHYVFSESDGRYPDLAYEPNPTGGGRGRWTWDEKRPRYLGEDFFATGINPADYAMLGGEAVFGGKAETYPTVGRIQRLLTEGYRWAGFGAWHLWLGSESAVGQYGSNADLAVFVREHNTTFGAGQPITRTLGIFNDTFHVDSPITVRWTLRVGGQDVTTGNQTRTVPRGTMQSFAISLRFPMVGKLTTGELVLTAEVDGKPVFRDTKELRVLPPTRPFPPPGATPGSRATQSVLVYDPRGSLTGYLVSQQYAITRVLTLDKLPPATPTSVLLIANDALTETEATAPRLAAFAASGGRVVVLEQKNPLKFTGLPAAVASTNASGRIAFVEDTAHPALAGLVDSDFVTFGDGLPLYTSAYEKPIRGAKSLLQCDQRLTKSALLEVPVGTGLMLLCQVGIGQHLGDSAPARQLFANLVGYAAHYKLTFRPVRTVVDPQSPLAAALTATGIQATTAADPLAALPPGGLAVLSATPATLATLAANKAKVDAFTQSGGYLVLHGLTAEGLAAFNKLVGVNHLLRPFRREKLQLAPRNRSALAAGMTAGDVTLLSGIRIFPWTSDEYVADDIFTTVVDFDEVARFGNVPDYKYFGLSDNTNDHNPENIYNGFTTTDGWVFAFMQWAGSGAPTPIPLTFAQPQTFTELEWTGNAIYYQTKEITLTFDGKETRKFSVAPGNTTQLLTITPPVTAAKVTLQITGWVPAKEPALVGIDNIRLKAQRPAAFYERVRPLTDAGGLIEYKNGIGGIVLCNLNLKPTEAVPVNATKKRALLATLLRNLKAPFSGGPTVIAGAAGLTYTPIDLSKQATQYRNERGWFGDPKQTFAALPTGSQTFASVPFQIFDFPTSPVPTCIMLGGPGVPNNCPERVVGIPVGRTADALFFLQTARIDQPRDPRDKNRYELARYVVTYADGKTETIPVIQDEHIADFRQARPQGLPGAALGWSRLYDGTPLSATAWVQQWNNPRPGTAIATVALEYGKDRRGVPVLLAVTAAQGATAR